MRRFTRSAHHQTPKNRDVTPRDTTNFNAAPSFSAVEGLALGWWWTPSSQAIFVWQGRWRLAWCRRCWRDHGMSWREGSNLQPAVYKFDSEQSEPTLDNVTPQENDESDKP